MPNAPRQFRPPTTAQPIKRKSSAERGYDARWQKYSAWRRRQPQEVLCGMCEQAATQMLDHVIAAKKPGAPAFDEPSNHCGLCWPCHRRKSVIVDSRFGHAPTKEGIELVERLKIVAAQRWAEIQAGMGTYASDRPSSGDELPGGM